MSPYLSALNRKYHRIKPKPDRKLEQYAIDLTGVLNRAALIAGLARGGSGLLVGDDDLVALFLAAYDLPLTLVEKDERIIAAIEENLPEGARFGVVRFDLRGVYEDRYPPVESTYDFVVTSPPYTKEGMANFLATGLRFLRVGGLCFIAAPHDATEKADEVTLYTQRFLLANGFLIEQVIPHMTIEEGLPAYQIVARKLHDVAKVDWLGERTGHMYEYEVWREDAYDHQIE
ncbi:MAG: bis-aminopropyl spermidine synthase family protein [Sandaracinaceae bacterium]|nr:bis-aminopropyl spermidine synthase family protein [Sandaracinaceae bacterium]